MKISTSEINGIKFINNKYCLSKTIRTTENIGLLQFSKQTISWDLYGSDFEMTKESLKKIFDYLLSLPNDAFRINKSRMVYSISSRGYSFILFNKDFIKENKATLLTTIYNILEDKNNYKKIGRKINMTSFDEICVYEEFKTEWEKLGEKYLYWMKKKKENKHYNRFRILERDEFKCKLCGKGPPEVELHIDHWTPKARGGLDIYENLVTLCSKCNLSKSTQIPKNKIEEVRDRK